MSDEDDTYFWGRIRRRTAPSRQQFIRIEEIRESKIGYFDFLIWI